MENAAVIVAAGRGLRAGLALPKQYATLAGEPDLRRTLRAFLGVPEIDAIRVVIHPDDRDLYEDAAAGFGLAGPVAGGATRAESVRRGLESLEDAAPRNVLIHDGARPFADPATIRAVLAALADAPAAIPVLPVTDTLRRGRDNLSLGTVPRDGLYRAQTPQGFRFNAILAAHRAAANDEATDDAALAEAAGLDVALVPGTEDNLKITNPDDLRRAERLLTAAAVPCVGHGFDVHRFGPGDHVMLCGVRVPHSQGLIGHSDADAGLHAVTDAVLGALGAGDIGEHFPPSDPRWKGAPSDRFLAHALSLVAEAGGRCVHADVTLICERPKIGPHKAAMRARLAEILDLPEARVGIKATTTEGLGFTGRGEGLAAQATATVLLPDQAR
jgi:2-C-methyl-D-erythritol 4-phosphate cytidylyltransferase/2-C-methyl-D-erythritol 2,4-cyclodiphosphate synthase